MRGKRFSIGLRAALAIFTVTLLVTSTWAATNWREKALYSFCSQTNCTDGNGPWAGLIFDAAGNLYGTTVAGGTYAIGTVFELTPNGSGGWTEKVLHSFNGTDGGGPFAGLIFDAAGNLYGTTYGGGDYAGTVFELTPTAGGGWTEQVLYSFCAQANCTDGYELMAGVIFDAAGNLYGTTFFGGTLDRGTVFELTPAAGGSWTEQVLYSFCSQTNCTDGDGPEAGLILDAAGNLYGTTGGGGTYGGGTVFELTPTAGGGWTETVLHSFNGTDGLSPSAGLIFDAAGNLYGTTDWGGVFKHCYPNAGCGTVFELTPAGGGGWTEQVLHSFGNTPDGAYPYAGLIFDAAGNLYGTTAGGGVFKNCSPNDYCGTVFELTPAAGGGWTETVLHNFNGTDGDGPLAGLIFDAAGNLYGTTPSSGTYGGGTAFELSPVFPCARCSHAGSSGEVDVPPAESRDVPEQGGLTRR